jgi:hypothetical protein
LLYDFFIDDIAAEPLFRQMTLIAFHCRHFFFQPHFIFAFDSFHGFHFIDDSLITPFIYAIIDAEPLRHFRHCRR